MISLLNRTLILILLIFPLSGQDLNQAWRDYMDTNGQLETLKSERSVYAQEQVNLKREVDQLQESSAWYNAWVVKYLLSNHSKRQLVILDSLRSIDLRIDRLKSTQMRDVSALKEAYESALTEYEQEGVRPSELWLKNLQLDRYNRVIETSYVVLFPDYSSILNIEWRSPDQRKHILIDVQRLLQAKIAELDSIRMVRVEEAELAERLADFHEDLGLQIASDQDAQQRDASGEPDKMLGWNYSDATANAISDESAGGSNRDAFGSDLNREPVDLININVSRDDVGEMSLARRSGNDLNYLKQKLDEYGTLLEQINQELDQSP